MLGGHRGYTSEFYRFRQTHAVAQKLKSKTQGEDLKVVEYLGGKAVYERHSCRQNFAVNSIKLCHVGIEHMHSGVEGGTLL